LGGQQYAMSDMITTLHLAANVPGEAMGRTANFSGKGFAENTFQGKARPPKEFDKWVEEVKSTAEPLTEDKFNELLEPGHLGQLTFSGTHLTFLPPPEGEYGGHHHGSTDSHESSKQHHDEHAQNRQDSYEKTKEHH